MPVTGLGFAGNTTATLHSTLAYALPSTATPASATGRGAAMRYAPHATPQNMSSDATTRYRYRQNPRRHDATAATGLTVDTGLSTFMPTRAPHRRPNQPDRRKIHTHRQTIKAFRGYFREANPTLLGPTYRLLRHKLFSDPIRMIMHIFSEVCQNPISRTTPRIESESSTESPQWIAEDCPNTLELNRLLFHASGNYPEKASRMPMLRGYLQRLLEWDGGGQPYNIADYNFLHDARLLKSVAAIRQDFKQHLQQTYPLLAAHPEVVHWLACQLLERYDPTLLRTDIDNFWYGRHQFTLIQADIHLLMDAELYTPSLGRREIRETAAAIRAAFSGDGALPQEILVSQLHAALLYRYAGQLMGHGDFAPNTYAEALLILHNLQVDHLNERFAPLRKALATLKIAPPMRRTLAEAALRTVGVNPFALGQAGLTIDSCMGRTKAIIDFYMDDCTDTVLDLLPPQNRDILPDLNHAYNVEFDAWHGQYAKALGKLLFYAIEELPPDDYHFWHNHRVDLLQPTLTATRYIPHVRPTFSGDPSMTKDIELADKRNLLFAADNGSERRYFQISIGAHDTPDTADTPIIKRIDTPNIEDYIDSHRDLYFKADALADTIDGALRTRTGVNILKTYPAGSHYRRFARTGEILAASVRQEIHEFGYERTDHRKSVDQIQEFLLGFIPGYDCVSAAIGDTPEDAVLPCTLDGYSIVVPLLSRLVKTATALARVPAKILLSAAATRELNAAFARHGTKHILRAVAHHMRAPMTEIGKDFAKGLGKDLLRIGDPGFEMTYQFLGEMRKLYALSRHLKNAPRILDDLIRQLRSNPHTPHAAHKLVQLRHQRSQHPLRVSKALTPPVLQTRYEGISSIDATGAFLHYDLPLDAKVRAMPYLKYEAPYKDLDDDILLYKINDRIYAWDSGGASELVEVQTLLSQLPLCRVPRTGGACVLLKPIAGNADDAKPGYQITFGQRPTNICQFAPGTQTRTTTLPALEIYPAAITIAEKQRQIVPMLDQPYEITATAGGKPKLQVIGDDWRSLRLEASTALLPATGKLVAYSHNANDNLFAIEFSLKSGVAECKIRAHYGNYPETDAQNNQIFRGMIRLNDDYIRVDFPDPAARAGDVHLTMALPAEIQRYNQFQTEALLKLKRSASKGTFSLTLSPAGTGSVLRLYRHYNLTPYRNLLDELALLPGMDPARAAKAVDMYIANPATPANAAAIAEFGQIKALADTILGNQHRSYDSSRTFKQHLADAIRQKNPRLDIHMLHAESPRTVQTLNVLGTIFPDLGPIRDQYMAKLATASASQAKGIEKDAVKSIRSVLRGRNVAYAEVRVPVDGKLVLQKTYFSVSGKQQGNRRGYQRIKTMAPNEHYVDANLVDAASKGLSEGPALSFPDFDLNNNELYRGHDAERLLLRMIRRDYPAGPAGRGNDAAYSIDMTTLLEPCVMCMQDLALFSDAYPQAQLNVMFVKSSSGAAGNLHRSLTRAGSSSGRQLRSIRPADQAAENAAPFLQLLAEAAELSFGDEEVD